MKIPARYVRCLLSLPVSHLGLGVVKGMYQPACGGLVKHDADAMRDHCDGVHGVGHGQWSEPLEDEEHYQRRDRICECGNIVETPNRDYWECGACREARKARPRMSLETETLRRTKAAATRARR